MKVITALDNPKFIKKLKEEKYEIIGKDIQYREAIIEILERAKKVDLIIVSEKIPGEINIENLIAQIHKINKKIKIIILLKNRNTLQIKNKFTFLCSEERFKVEEINILINNKKIENKKLILKENAKIITIFGNKKVGKTTISILLINYLINKNKKVLLINLNEKNNRKNNKKYFNNKKIENNYLKIFEKENSDKKILKNLEIKVNKNLKLINNLEINLKNNKVIYRFQIEKFLEDIILHYKNEYDFIVFDTESMKDRKWITEILKISTNSIGVIDENLIGIKEMKRFCQKYEKEFFSNKSSLHIIRNKCNIFSIHQKIIGHALDNFSKIHNIHRRKKYKFALQKFTTNKKIKLDRKIKKIFLEIIN